MWKTWLKMPRARRAVCVLSVLACALTGFGSAGAPRTLRADVFVAGAGPAGFVAAIAAARNGAKVTLAESLGFPGGMATAGLVGPISKFKAGRFYSLMGYEGPGDSRFFYTYGRTFEMTPVTHTGAIATFCGIQNMEWSVGWVMGENNMFSRGYDESLITGGVKLYNGDWVSLKYAFVAGDGAMGGAAGDLFRNDVVLTANLGNCWGAAFLFNCGKFDGEGGGSWGTSATLNDLAQYYGNIKYQSWGTYLYYTLSPNWKLGTRMEWQRGVDTDETDGMEILEISAGVNWMPTACDNFAIRLEIRYDKAHMADASGYDGMFGNGLAHDDQFTLACDMIYKF